MIRAGNKEQPLLSEEHSEGHAVGAEGSVNQTTEKSAKGGVQVAWRRNSADPTETETESGERRCGVPAEDFKALVWALVIAVMIMFIQVELSVIRLRNVTN